MTELEKAMEELNQTKKKVFNSIEERHAIINDELSKLKSTLDSGKVENYDKTFEEMDYALDELLK